MPIHKNQTRAIGAGWQDQQSVGVSDDRTAAGCLGKLPKGGKRSIWERLYRSLLAASHNFMSSVIEALKTDILMPSLAGIDTPSRKLLNTVPMA